MSRHRFIARSALASGVLALLGFVACGGDPATGGATSAGGAGGNGETSSTTRASTGAGASGQGGTGGTGGAATGGGGGTTTGSGGAQGCLQDLSAGHHKVSCDGGVDYDVEIPAACANGPCGLIVDIHGYTMTGNSEDANTNMRALGQQHDYVVVQPTAPKDNFGFPSWDQATHVPLVYAFLADLAASLPIDPKRIHPMGFSQGGGMTYRLICTHADFFASGAPAGALPGCEFSGANMPSEEVDILQVHGHTDAIVNFDSQAIPQRDAALAAWPFGQPTVIESDPGHTATRWVTTNGTVFEFWAHTYETSAQVVFVSLKGHCVPGGMDFNGSPAGYSCENTNTFVFGELAMQFFLDHPKN